MEQVQLSLTLEEINQILGAIGQQPYVEIFRLINKIQEQVEPQVKSASDDR